MAEERDPDRETRSPKFDPAELLYGPPRPPLRQQREPRHWGPGNLPGEISRRDYVVIEEVVDDYVGLVVSPWPRVGKTGGLEFPPEDERREVVIDRASFQQRLTDREVVAYEVPVEEQEALQSRPVTTGDVFAIETDLPPEEHDCRGLGSRWISGDVIDVTAVARDAAKAAMLAALSGGPMSAAEVAAYSEPSPETPPRPPADE